MTTQHTATSAMLTDRIDSLVSNLKNAADHLSSAAATFKHKASDAKSHALSRAGSIAAHVGKAIQDHPMVALGVALGAGFLVLRLIRR